jgi:hypothetical protein
MNHNFNLTSLMLITTLLLTGCVLDEAEKAAAPIVAESTVPQAQTETSAQPDIDMPKINYFALSSQELLDLAEDNVNIRDQKEFKQALSKSIANAEEEGVVEISRLQSGILTTSNYIPRMETSGVSFVSGEDGKAFEDSISNIDRSLLNLYSLNRSMEANAFRGITKQPSGEIVLKLVPGGISEGKVFVFVVSLNSNGLIENMISTSNYEEFSSIVETKVEYGSVEEASLMLAKLSTSS